MANLKTLVVSLLAGTSLVSAKQLKVMFVGNSFTFVNDLPGQIANVAQSLGDELVHKRSVIGGCTLWAQRAEVDKVTAALLEEGDWDFIVLQDYSMLPTVERARSEYLHPAIQSFAQHKRSAKIVMYMTWGYHDGLTSSNCPSSDTGSCFPNGSLAQLTNPPCSSNNSYKDEIHDFPCMGYSLARGYQSTLAEDGVDMVAPCGAAWQVVRGFTTLDEKCKDAVDSEYADKFPLEWPFKVDGASAADVELYRPGNTNPGHDKHPNCAGQYLNALTFYATLFGKSPLNATGPLKTSSDFGCNGELSSQQKLAMQRAAAGVVARCGTSCGLGAEKVVQV